MATHRYSDGYRSFREADPGRQVAFEVLTLVRNEDAYANLVLPKVLKSFEGQAHLDQRDRAFAVELSYARRLEPSDGAVSFDESARQTWLRIRAVIPSPGAYTEFRGQRLKLGKVSLTDVPSPGPGRLIVSKKSVLVGCTDFCLELGQVAPAGKKWMDAAAWARGARLDEHTVLGQEVEAN